MSRSVEADVERGRRAYGEHRWLEAYEALSAADAVSPLGVDELELLSVIAIMLGRDDEGVALLERAHHLLLDGQHAVRASRCAMWICLNLAGRGAMGPATGWLGRARRLLDQQPDETAEHGLLLLPVMFQHEAAGDFAQAAATAAEAAAIGERHGDRDLFALATFGQGMMLIKDGRVKEGTALLDEGMVSATAGELTPVVTGIVYCGVILACQEAFDVRRAREWTLALQRWWDTQPEMVAFTGRCLVHRAEIMQLNGAWGEALEVARLAARRFVETQNRHIGLAYYREAELLRLQGEFDAAESSYREASRAGWAPQPGLAQLRLAQGRGDAALAAIRVACTDTTESLKLATLLPAYVEIALAAGDSDAARAAFRELEAVVERYESTMLQGIVAHARGALAIADGDAAAALVALRAATGHWLELDLPYEIARTRALMSEACRALGDEEAAALELDAARALFRELGAVPDLARLDPPTPADRHGLSRRELEVLRLLAAGKTNREIASELVISEHTVARHVQNIFAKVRVTSRSAATAFAFEHDLV